MPISTPPHYLEKYNDGKEHFKHVFDYLFAPSIEACGLEPIAPTAEGDDIIHARIIENLDSADLVLCDMSALNPNVFFEFGIRTALNKSVCLVKDDATLEIPFDASIINFHIYSSELAPWSIEEDIKLLKKHIKQSISQQKKENSLWKYFGLSTQAHRPEINNEDSSKYEYLTLQVEGLRKQIERVAGKTPESFLDTEVLHKSSKRSQPPTKNNLQKILDSEGLTKTELSRHSDVSAKTITIVTNQSRTVSDVTKHRILKGLNSFKKRAQEYEFNEIFPYD